MLGVCTSASLWPAAYTAFPRHSGTKFVELLLSSFRVPPILCSHLVDSRIDNSSTGTTSPRNHSLAASAWTLSPYQRAVDSEDANSFPLLLLRLWPLGNTLATSLWNAIIALASQQSSFLRYCTPRLYLLKLRTPSSHPLLQPLGLFPVYQRIVEAEKGSDPWRIWGGAYYMSLSQEMSNI